MTGVFIRKSETLGIRPAEDGDRAWSEAAKSQAPGPPGQGVREGPSPKPQEGARFCHTLVLDLQPPEL